VRLRNRTRYCPAVISAEGNTAVAENKETKASTKWIKTHICSYRLLFGIDVFWRWASTVGNTNNITRL